MKTAHFLAAALALAAGALPAMAQGPARPQGTAQGTVQGTAQPGAPQKVAQAAPAAAAPAVGGAVEAIRARGHLLCGVSPATPGFALQDGRGEWRGLDVDYCRAVAAALLGDAAKARFVPVPAAERFDMLRRGAIDILARATTWTLERDVGEGGSFAAVTYFDGQGFLVRRATGVSRVQQLDGAKVCVEAGTTSEQNLAEYARTMHLNITPVAARGADATRAAFMAQYCDALTSDTAALAGFMAQQGSNAANYAILYEVISKEPLGPVVREGDRKLFSIARWVHFAMLAAEELGLDSKTVASLKAGPAGAVAESAQEVQRLFGIAGRSGELLGLDADWGARVIRQVGNYREVWERNIQPLGLQRGLNLLWNQGGLQYAPPIR